MEQQVPGQEVPNLMCILPGKEEGTLVVGASSDYRSPDAMTSDGWSTLTALPLLAESLSLVPHRFTLMFIAFTEHQNGMQGASWYVSQLTDAQRKSIRAMVNLNSLGKAPPVFTMAQSDNTLATWLQVAAQALRIPIPAQVDASTANSPPHLGLRSVKEENLWANATPFQQQLVPAIALRSGTSATAFDIDAYEDTYRLMCAYVLYLDSNLGRPLVEPGIYSGKIVDTAGIFPTSPIVDVSVKIDRFSTTGELNRYESILGKGGQDGLADALDEQNDEGNFRFGQSLVYGVKMVALQSSDKKPYILLVAPRVRRPPKYSREYRFTVIKLTLDGTGSGDGFFYNTAKLRFNKQHELIIEDFGSTPDAVEHVRLDQPALPRTNPVKRPRSARHRLSTSRRQLGATANSASLDVRECWGRNHNAASRVDYGKPCSDISRQGQPRPSGYRSNRREGSTGSRTASVGLYGSGGRQAARDTRLRCARSRRKRISACNASVCIFTAATSSCLYQSRGCSRRRQSQHPDAGFAEHSGLGSGIRPQTDNRIPQDASRR